jgi:N-acetylneuraminic acid mutarotase
MKYLFTISCVLFYSLLSFTQQLPNLPIPLGAGTCEVWNNSIYHFGGSNNWSGSICYPRVYRFDGTNWAYEDSIPDNNMWGVTSVLVGDDVYLIGAWPYGPELNRRYNLNTGEWVYLAESPNTYHTWGITAELLSGIIYLFNPDGECFAYDIATDTWSNRTFNSATGTRDLSSILYQNEIYIIGWDNSTFYKYTPSADQWTQLSNSPYQVGACAMGIINNLIYFVGGNSGGSHGAEYKTILVYDITINGWSIDLREISSKRHWMATAEYKGGLYVVGGIDSIANAVDIVEEIVPQGTAGVRIESEIPESYSLSQNYPNPFNPGTKINYSIPEVSFISLKVYDVLGNEIVTLVNEEKYAGNYSVDFKADALPSGTYFYKLTAGNFSETRKMILLR